MTTLDKHVCLCTLWIHTTSKQTEFWVTKPSHPQTMRQLQIYELTAKSRICYPHVTKVQITSESVSQIGRQQSIKGINNIRQIVYVRFGHYRGGEEHTHLMPVTVVSLGLLKATGSIVTAGGFHAHHLQALPLPVKSTQNTRISANGTFILCLHHPMSEAQFLQAYLGWNAAADMTSLQESHQEWNWQYD